MSDRLTQDSSSSRPKEDPEKNAENTSNGSSGAFPIVGIGASAGGIEACSELIGALSVDTGMAFVIVQHISAESPSFLPQIFERVTDLPVESVEQDQLVQPNHIYVIVPGKQITLSEGRLQLAPRDLEERPFMPIDRFFGSLAADCQEGTRGTAIGVVLSGFDGDGAKGLSLIKQAGGITFAQNLNSAQFDSMPNTAVETGMVDFILPPAAIARLLADIADMPYLTQAALAEQVAEAQSEQRLAQASQPGFSGISALLRSHTGIDFSQYKPATFERRAQRRMALCRLSEAEYMDYLQDHPDEIDALYRDVLISVTGFFRDDEAYAFIADTILPALVQQKRLDSSIRIWVAGCSSGEECYSIAICLFEHLAAKKINLSIQIFGTDANEAVVDIARQGIYTESQMTGVSFERRQRFFRRIDDDRYQISKAVRELCVFARQDLSSDPPFSNVDLTTCRNVMIYFARPLQERVLSIFHYSLNPGGYLWLGSSESVGETSELFSAIDRRHKVYSRRETNERLNFDFVGNSQRGLNAQPSSAKLEPPDAAYSNVRRQADQIVLGRYAPVGVVIDEAWEVLHFRGDTSSYLGIAPGEPSFNLLKMARPELLLDLREMVEQVKDQNIVVRREDLQVGRSKRYITVEATPIRNPVSQERSYLVLFEEGALIGGEVAADAEPSETLLSDPTVFSKVEKVLAATRRELLDTQAYLQSIVEEKEAANQRLTTATEEILSSNEELQSTNEELQTAKEEIQAANEEMRSTNEELKDRNADSQLINDDLLNLLYNVNIPIVILSNDLRVRRFTPIAQQLFKLIPTDIGRPLSDIRIDIDVPNLEQTVREVIDSLDPQESEVQDSQGRWYQLRIRPYRTAENQIDGAVMALVDTTDIKQTQRQLEQSRGYAEAIVETVGEPLLVLGEDLIVRTANRAFYETFQVSHLVTEGKSLFELGDGQWDMAEVRSHIASLLESACHLDPLEITREFERIGAKTVLLKAREIRRSGPDRLILISIEDITERQQAEAERLRLVQEQTARAEAEAANVGKDQFLSVVSHELRNPLNAILGWSSLLTKVDDPSPEMVQKAMTSVHRGAITQSRIISDLLEVSRIIQGKISLQTAPTNLSDLLAAVVGMVQPDAEAADITLISELEPSSDYFLLDADRLHQVFGNALSNAIKFTPTAGQIQIALTYEGVTEGTSATQARICITDNGAGIPAEFLPHIFDRFRQANSSNTRQYGGLGLGLTIAKSFVTAHGGTVDISSPGEGQGTTLTVLLPLTPARANAASGNETDRSDLRLSDLRLLLVEDDLNSLEMMLTVLELEGAFILTANSVDRAIEWLESDHQIDLLVSDISLPERDGFDLIHWVRSHPTPEIRALPAIAVTGYATRTDTDSLIAAGFSNHLPKPITLEELVSDILSALPPSS